jgi:predicted metal-binding membrane protein
MHPSVRLSGPASLIAVAAIATAAAWAYTISTASAMSASMPMPGGWSMSMAWMSMGSQSPVAHAAMFLVMWTAMMIAMMLPSVMPAVLLHRRVIQVRLERGVRDSGSDVLLLAGYFSVWVAFGAVAYAIGMTLAYAAMGSIRVSVLVPAATGVALAAAGAYQLTQWKQDCLRHCRSPLDFFARHEIRRAADSWRFGVHHGAYCAACCWGLMVIQLVLGVMSVPLMALVALVILLEKQWRHGQLLARVVGAASVTVGIFIALRATMRG